MMQIIINYEMVETWGGGEKHGNFVYVSQCKIKVIFP